MTKLTWSTGLLKFICSHGHITIVQLQVMAISLVMNMLIDTEVNIGLLLSHIVSFIAENPSFTLCRASVEYYA